MLSNSSIRFATEPVPVGYHNALIQLISMDRIIESEKNNREIEEKIA